MLSGQGLCLKNPPLGPLEIELWPGEIALLTGSSGSGKTRLLRLLADLDSCVAGQIMLAGQSLESYRPSEYRLKVAYLPATPDLGTEPIAELFQRVAQFRHRPREADPRVWLPRLGVDEGLLHRPASVLSTGEAVRVALVVLLSARPQVFLLDEPTGSLDPANARAVEYQIQEQVGTGAAALWVTHDPQQAARVGDCLYQLRTGVLHGPHRDPKAFATLIQQHAEVEE